MSAHGTKKARVTICLSPELAACLRGSDINWSAVCEAALRRALDGESADAEALALREEVGRLREALAKVAVISLVGLERRQDDPDGPEAV